jgi:hypothetical protein
MTIRDGLRHKSGMTLEEITQDDAIPGDIWRLIGHYGPKYGENIADTGYSRASRLTILRI